MARRYRRTGRYSRRLKTVKYSNETASWGGDINGGTAITMVAGAQIQGMRKCKNFELKLSVGASSDIAPSNAAIAYALVYVPENTSPHQLNFGTDSSASNLYTPDQNVIMSGTCNLNGAVTINRTRLARNLNSGDSIALIIQSIDITAGSFKTIATLNYAMTF